MIKVVMTTYAPENAREREHYADRVAYSLWSNLKTTDKLSMHVADDGSFSHKYIETIAEYSERNWKYPSTTSNSHHKGIGASLNLAQQFISGHSMWMYITDDWLLTSPLDLDPAIKLIKYGYDLVRLGPIHPNLKCTTKFKSDIGWWLDIDPTYGFAFATRPFLASERFYTRVGPFSTHCNAYQCEQWYAERVAKTDGIAIAYLGTISMSGPWQHIGEVEVGNIDC